MRFAVRTCQFLIEVEGVYHKQFKQEIKLKNYLLELLRRPRISKYLLPSSVKTATRPEVPKLTINLLSLHTKLLANNIIVPTAYQSLLHYHTTSKDFANLSIESPPPNRTQNDNPRRRTRCPKTDAKHSPCRRARKPREGSSNPRQS